MTPEADPTPDAPTLAEAWNREHPGDPMLAPAQRSVRAQPPRSTSSERRGSALLVLATPLVGIVLGVAIWNTGVFDSGSTPGTSATASHAHAAATPGPQALGRSTVRRATPRSKPAPNRPLLGAHRVFAGRTISVAYPAGWTPISTEAPRSWGTDTTIVSPTDPHTLIRVDVTMNPITHDPAVAAAPIIAAVSRQPGYRELSLTTGALGGFTAERWQFVVVEAGVLLRKEDDFFTAHTGDGMAILTSAPAGAYASLAKRFAALRQTLSVH